MWKFKLKDTKEIIENSYRSIFNASIYILLFEIIYKALIYSIFKPTINIITSFFIRIGGYQILLNGEIRDFILSIPGVIMVIILALLSILLVYFEFTYILVLIDKSRNRERINLVNVSKITLVHIDEAFSKFQLRLGLYILLLIPLLNVGIQSSLLPSISIPNFIYGEVEKYRGGDILVSLLLMALLYIFARLFLVMPIMVFSNKSYSEASRLSFRLMSKQVLKVGLLIGMAFLSWWIIGSLPFILLEDSSFIILRLLRLISNILRLAFTLLLSPFLLAISHELYSRHVGNGELTRSYNKNEIELGLIGQTIWSLMVKALNLVGNLLARVKINFKTTIVFIVFIIGISIYQVQEAYPLEGKQYILGHRGSAYGVENTINTIIEASELGADYVEMDVLLSKDSIAMVIHDNNLKRLSKKSYKISDLLEFEIKELDITDGINFDKIASLRELSKAIAEKDVKLLLEFKLHGKEEDSIVDKTVETLREEGVLDKVIFQTSDYGLIKEMDEKYPDLTLGYIFFGKMGKVSAKTLSSVAVDFFSVEESLVTERFIREAHKNDKLVFAWTVNEAYKMESLLELGVDGIITDYPEVGKEVRDKYVYYFNELFESYSK